MSSPFKRRTGPIDEADSPATIDAHVVTPGPRPRLQGYDVEGDLAVHYGLVESVILSLTGELPEAWQTRATEVALTFFAPTLVSEAPAHAAVLSRICGGRSSASFSVGAVTLAEQTHALIERSHELLDWLESCEGSPPVVCVAASDEDRESVDRLRAALAARDVELPVLDHDLSREPALLAVLHSAGLREPAHLEVLIMTSRFPCVIAEALAWSPRAFRAYPMDLPRFRYKGER